MSGHVSSFECFARRWDAFNFSQTDRPTGFIQWNMTMPRRMLPWHFPTRGSLCPPVRNSLSTPHLISHFSMWHVTLLLPPFNGCLSCLARSLDCKRPKLIHGHTCTLSTRTATPDNANRRLSETESEFGSCQLEDSAWFSCSMQRSRMGHWPWTWSTTNRGNAAWKPSPYLIGCVDFQCPNHIAILCNIHIKWFQMGCISTGTTSSSHLNKHRIWPAPFSKKLMTCLQQRMDGLEVLAFWVISVNNLY